MTGLPERSSSTMDLVPGYRGPSHRAIDPAGATRAGVAARTRELAALAGRVPPYVTQADYQQAKRELTGETDLERQNAMLDAQPVSTARFR